MGLFEKSKSQEQLKQQDVSEAKSSQKATSKSTNEKNKKELSQKDHVFKRIQDVVKNKNISVGKGKPVSSFLEKEHRKHVVDSLVTGFKSKKIPLKDTENNRKKLSDDKLLRDYCTGLLKNWLERDKRLQNQDGEFLQG
jgi:hypothetical protein